MTLSRASFLATAVSGLLVLAGCEEGQTLLPSASPQGETRAEPTTVERDVEAPEVFEANEAGLWDGRPSLGGIWIAHPGVTTPERVMIRNTENDKFVMGALFRRERENPGPALQVSSDAAAELGMLAGAPTQLSVVAIRRETVTIEPDVVEPANASGGEIEQDTLEPISAMAEAAIDAATTGSAASSPKPLPRPAVPAPAPVAAAEPAAATAPAPAPAPTPSMGLEKPFIQIGIFSDQRNAEQVSELLSNSGVIPTTKPFTNNGKNYWRVVVGPFSTQADVNALLKKVNGLGFGDAYPVTN